MRNILSILYNLIKQKRGLFTFLIILSLVMMVLGVIASISFTGGVLVVDLENIAYIQFLKNECGFVSLLFKLSLGLFIFVIIICLCGVKWYLFPISIIFYGYLIYSQTVIFMSIIFTYGFFNCVIFSLILLIYILTIFFVVSLLVVDISCCCNSNEYFKTIFKFKSSNVALLSLFIMFASLVFSLTLIILKSFVLLLVY